MINGDLFEVDFWGVLNSGSKRARDFPVESLAWYQDFGRGTHFYIFSPRRIVQKSSERSRLPTYSYGMVK